MKSAKKEKENEKEENNRNVVKCSYGYDNVCRMRQIIR